MKDGYALITGSSVGIGRAMADCFAAEGIPVVLVARSREKLKKASAEISEKYSVKVRIYTLDLSVAGSAEELYKWAVSEN